MLHPIFEEASNVIKEEYPNENQVVFARVDCDQHCKYHRKSGRNCPSPTSPVHTRTHTYTNTRVHTFFFSFLKKCSALSGEQTKKVLVTLVKNVNF